MAASDGESSISNLLKTLAPAISSSFELLKRKLENMTECYQKMVVEEPEKVAKIESTLNMVSFILPGSFRSSDIVSELVYFATKMLSLLHDLIYRKKFCIMHEFLWTEKTYLETALTVLEYTEAFLELGAARLWGEPGKWLIIFILQILKAALKIVLLYVFDTGIQHSPSLMFIKEKLKFNEPNNIVKNDLTTPQDQDNMEKAWQEASTPKKKFDVWTGKRSGRIVRSLKSAPPKGFRDWNLPKKSEDDQDGIDYYKEESKLTDVEKLAELGYILRPLGHLSSMFVCGENSWKPWILSLLIDLSSLHHLNSKRTLQKIDRDELTKRKAALLLYLLRSPFYDKYSKARIITFLDGCARWVPGMKLVAHPLIEYLPVWQKMYSHIWSN